MKEKILEISKRHGEGYNFPYSIAIKEGTSASVMPILDYRTLVEELKQKKYEHPTKVVYDGFSDKEKGELEKLIGGKK